MKECLYSKQEGTWFYGNWNLSNTSGSKFYKYVCFIDKITCKNTEVSVAQKNLQEKAMKHVAKPRLKDE